MKIMRVYLQQIKNKAMLAVILILLFSGVFTDIYQSLMLSQGSQAIAPGSELYGTNNFLVAFTALTVLGSLNLALRTKFILSLGNRIANQVHDGTVGVLLRCHAGTFL